MSHAWLPIIRMHVLQPAKPHCGSGWRARVFIEPAANVVTRTVGLPVENDVGSRLHNRIQLLILLRKVDVQLLQCDCFPFQFLRALHNALFEFDVEQLQLAVLAV